MKGFFKSVNAALEGVIHSLHRERNMRLHFIAGFFVLIAGIYLNLDHEEIILLLFAITFVLVAEMFNTAIEHLADLIVKKEFHPVIKIVKDVSAGAVFVAAVNAGVTGYLLVANRVDLRAGGLLIRIKQSPWHITLIAMLVCVGSVLLVKVIRREESLLRGGMPSGHSAVAFAIWVSVSLLTLNPLVSGLVFLLAVLVARSRMMTGVHSIWEVLAGCIVGALSALLVFQVLL
ncbi:MAG: diacylglycerol kinase [Candidatus Omnitrophica bacterium]|nr:diacylglycerol kinase [Candidatus Omnitrophota bacterium]